MLTACPSSLRRCHERTQGGGIHVHRRRLARQYNGALYRWPSGIEDDIAAVRKTVLAQLEAGHQVVVVTHSYSSIPGTAALHDLSISARKTAGKTGGVRGAVIISGFLLPPGTTMLAVMGGQLAPQYLHENDYTPSIRWSRSNSCPLQRSRAQRSSQGSVEVETSILRHQHELDSGSSSRTEGYSAELFALRQRQCGAVGSADRDGAGFQGRGRGSVCGGCGQWA